MSNKQRLLTEISTIIAKICDFFEKELFFSKKYLKYSKLASFNRCTKKNKTHIFKTKEYYFINANANIG